MKESMWVDGCMKPRQTEANTGLHKRFTSHCGQINPVHVYFAQEHLTSSDRQEVISRALQLRISISYI